MIRFEDVVRAKKFLENLIKKTPVVRCQFLSEFCGGEVYLKLENLQISNSCKIRGAFNKMLTLGSEMKQGVVAASSGNHSIAVAIAAKKLNLPVKIVVPESTPKVKIEKIMKYDVGLMLYGNIYDDAERKALELARKEGLTYISPYNDNFVIAGQGTIGLEILDEYCEVDSIITCTKVLSSLIVDLFS